VSRHIRHCLEFVNLENPQLGLSLVRLEERIMIGAEMPRCALTLDGSVEQAADIGGRDGSPVHAHSDEATRALVHDHEQTDRFRASRNVA
jgi:hypothetical protein